MGKDPATNKVAEGVEAQAHFMFQHMRTLLEAAGGTLENVGHVTVFIKDDSAREPVNKEWLKCFPEPTNRPARHTLTYDLQHGMIMQLEFVAVLDRNS
jgi:2-iminobutanoate/2-iminopropanoate deaminase